MASIEEAATATTTIQELYTGGALGRVERAHRQFFGVDAHPSTRHNDLIEALEGDRRGTGADEGNEMANRSRIRSARKRLSRQGPSLANLLGLACISMSLRLK